MRKILHKLTGLEWMTAGAIVLILIGIASNKKKDSVTHEVQITNHDRPELKNKYGPEIGLMQVGDNIIFPGSNDQYEITSLTLERVTLTLGGRTTDFTWDELKNADVRVIGHSGPSVIKTKPPSS